MKRALFILATTFVGFASAGSASSPQAATQPAPSAKKMLDPNEMVCEKQAVPGSRHVQNLPCKRDEHREQRFGEHAAEHQQHGECAQQAMVPQPAQPFGDLGT